MLFFSLFVDDDSRCVHSCLCLLLPINFSDLIVPTLCARNVRTSESCSLTPSYIHANIAVISSTETCTVCTQSFSTWWWWFFFTSVCDRAEQCKVTTTSIERETLTWHTNRGGQTWSSRVKFGAVEAHITPQFTLFSDSSFLFLFFSLWMFISLMNNVHNRHFKFQRLEILIFLSNWVRHSHELSMKAQSRRLRLAAEPVDGHETVGIFRPFFAPFSLSYLSIFPTLGCGWFFF